MKDINKTTKEEAATKNMNLLKAAYTLDNFQLTILSNFSSDIARLFLRTISGMDEKDILNLKDAKPRDALEDISFYWIPPARWQELVKFRANFRLKAAETTMIKAANAAAGALEILTEQITKQLKNGKNITIKTDEANKAIKEITNTLEKIRWERGQVPFAKTTAQTAIDKIKDASEKPLGEDEALQVRGSADCARMILLAIAEEQAILEHLDNCLGGIPKQFNICSTGNWNFMTLEESQNEPERSDYENLRKNSSPLKNMNSTTDTLLFILGNKPEESGYGNPHRGYGRLPKYRNSNNSINPNLPNRLEEKKM